MEIRTNCCDTMEEPTDEASKTNDIDRPISPCVSEISVGCENRHTDASPSPMDMVSQDAITETINERPHSPKIPSQRRPISPGEFSPESGRESSSYSYMSEEEYFRPLKRLAMSDASPPPSCVATASFSSPERQIREVEPEKVVELGEESCERISEAEQEDETRRSRLLEGEKVLEIVPDMDNKLSGLRSFSIMDILSYRPSKRKSSVPVKIVRPWDTRERLSDTDHNHLRPNPLIKSSHKRSNHHGDRGKGGALDALFKMTNKTLDNLNNEDKTESTTMFNNRQQNKKKRKSRTAFTNHQIFELEKRFLYQKYLSPADRDELAQSLGLSNAQVITWFQNRRAKLKRDMEELKRDVESSKAIHNKAFLEASANVVAFLKSKDLQKIPLTSLPH